MEVLERIEAIQKGEGLKREEFANKAKIAYTRLNNIFSGRAKIRHEEIELIGNAFPEYAFWIAYGKELPEAGQISPMTKATQEDYRQQGKAG